MNKSNIKLLTTIVDRGQGEKIAAICRRQQLTFHLVCLGLGLATLRILKCLAWAKRTRTWC